MKVLEFFKTANLLWLASTAALIGEAIRSDNNQWFILAGITFVFTIASSVYVSQKNKKG